MKKSEYSVAVIGATGVVGEEIVRALTERGFPAATVRAFARREAVGKTLFFGGSELPLEELREGTSLEGTDFVFLAAGAEVSKGWTQRAVAAGAVVIDTSDAWDERADVPVVVPEVNARDLHPWPPSRVVRSPDAVTIALAVFLQPLRQFGALERVVVTAFDPVSTSGRQGVTILEQEVYELLNGREPEDNDTFPERVAFNLFPQVGELRPDGTTEAEARVLRSLERVLHEPSLPVFLTRVQVPLFYGTAATVHVEFAHAPALEGLLEHLRASPGLFLEEEPLACPSAAAVMGSDATHVGRVRVDKNRGAVDAWLVLDNTRKGSAVNAVQIAEVLLREPR